MINILESSQSKSKIHDKVRIEFNQFRGEVYASKQKTLGNLQLYVLRQREENRKKKNVQVTVSEL